jgi:hypothetical protein
MTEEGQSENTGLDKFANAALRGPRKGVYEQLLSGLLIKANQNSDPLMKIQAICEAANLTNEKSQLNMDFVDVAFTVSRAFLNTEVISEKGKAEHVDIPWPFPLTEENFNKYVKPWFTVTCSYYPFLTALRREKYPTHPCFNTFDYNAKYEWERSEEIRQEIHDEILKMPRHESFFIQTSVLCKHSFTALKGNFAQWALPQALTIQTELAKQVHGKVYSEVFRMMFGKEKTEQNEVSDKGSLE